MAENDEKIQAENLTASRRAPFYLCRYTGGGPV